MPTRTPRERQIAGHDEISGYFKRAHTRRVFDRLGDKQHRQYQRRLTGDETPSMAPWDDDYWRDVDGLWELLED